MSKDKFWSRKYLFLSAATSAGVNFLSAIIIVKGIGFESFGIWLSIKSMIQLSTILNFGISNYLLFLNPEREHKEFKFTNYIATYLAVPYTLSVLIIFNLYYDKHDLSDLTIPFLLYVIALYLSGNSTLNLRAVKNGKIIFYSNILESLFGLIFSVVLLLYPSLELFIYLQALRFFIKFLIQNYYVKSFVISCEKISNIVYLIFKTGFSIHLRNWIQTISQYGDKLLLPVLFGFGINGSLGMGSNFALPIIILISSTNILLIPKVIETNELQELRNEFELKLVFILKLSVTLAFLIPFTFWFFDDNGIFLLLGYWLSISINLFQVASIWYYKKEKVLKNVVFLSSLIVISYLSIIINAQFFKETISIFLSIAIIICLNIVVFYRFIQINIKYLLIFLSFFLISIISTYLLSQKYLILLIFCFSIFIGLSYFYYSNLIKENALKLFRTK